MSSGFDVSEDPGTHPGGTGGQLYSRVLTSQNIRHINTKHCVLFSTVSKKGEHTVPRACPVHSQEENAAPVRGKSSQEWQRLSKIIRLYRNNRKEQWKNRETSFPQLHGCDTHGKSQSC